MFRNLYTTAAVLVVAAAAGSAGATTFSFASDFNSNGFTFAGTAGAGGTFTISQANLPNTFQLIIDDNNGPLPSITVPVEFRASFTASGHVAIPQGSLTNHSYIVTGSFGFYQSGNPLLTCTIGSSGLLQVPGTATTWSTAGAVLGSDTFTTVTYSATQLLVNAITAAGGNAANYGIFAGGNSVGPDDFVFDWTQIHGATAGSTVLLNANGAPTTVFGSESSYSGSANGVPTPGAVAMLLGAGLVGLRRRRA